MKTPILFLIFNRPETTRQVFAEIRKAKPPKLFIASDGPRENKPGEFEKCQAARKIVEKIDWKCQVEHLYRDKNLGCKMAVSSAIDWFFDNVEEGIILEDDCLPDQSFFRFCEENLLYYRTKNEVMHITGNNFQNQKNTSDSYYYSIFPHIWGWATWRRSWIKYHQNDIYASEKRKIFISKFSELNQKIYWQLILSLVERGKIDTWDYRWFYICVINQGLSVTPNVNLVENIGFSDEATHTKRSSTYLGIPAKQVHFPLKHPRRIIRNTTADSFIASNNFRSSPTDLLYLAIKNLI